MAVPSSGELRLYADIGLELGVPQSDVSLGSMSDSAGFAEPDAMSDFYGYSDYTAPTVSTSTPTAITGTSMQLNGFFQRASIESPGITEWGFYFGTNPNRTSNPKYSGATVAGNGFYMNRTGLGNSTTYYIWAYVVDSVQETVGLQVSQATNAPFAPAFATNKINEGGSKAGTARLLDRVDTLNMLYYNTDTASYVQYGSYSKTTQNTETLDKSYWTKSGSPTSIATNTQTLAYYLTTMNSSGSRGAQTGMQENNFLLSGWPPYMNGRSNSGGSSGFSPGYGSYFAVSNSNVVVNTTSMLETTLTQTYTAGATIYAYYYFSLY